MNDLRSLRMKLYKFCLEDLFMKALPDDGDEDDYEGYYDEDDYADSQDAGSLTPEEEMVSWCASFDYG